MDQVGVYRALVREGLRPGVAAHVAYQAALTARREGCVVSDVAVASRSSLADDGQTQVSFRLMPVSARVTINVTVK